MSILLKIPIELRDKILSLVILSPAISVPKPPMDDDDGNDANHSRSELEDTRSICSSWSTGKNVKYLTHTYSTNPTPLLFVNRQLRQETIAAISLLRKLKVPTLYCYILDIMIVNEWELWPTWLHVPVLTERVEEVYTTVRICGANKRTYSGFTGGWGDPPRITWYFYKILEYFLRAGPVTCQEDRCDRIIGLKRLVIDIQTPNVPEELRGPEISPYDLTRLRLEDNKPYIMNPNSVAKFLKEMIDYLSRMTIHTAMFGAIFYERLGKIVLQLDGNLIEEWDFAINFDRVRVVDIAQHYPRLPADQIERDFKAWKARAYQMRMDLGLGVHIKEKSISEAA